MYALPQALTPFAIQGLNLFAYQIGNAVSNSHIILEQSVLCFLVEQGKTVNFSYSNAQSDNEKAVMMMQGNCLMSEEVDKARIYHSVLLFFSKQTLNDFLVKYDFIEKVAIRSNTVLPFFVLEKDDYMQVFVQSLFVLSQSNLSQNQNLLALKFEEIMLYLKDKYGLDFIHFLQNHVSDTHTLSFRGTIEAYKYKKVTVDDLAFLCNMSRSTFKRHFEDIYHETPAKWLKDQRLNRAKELLQLGYATPSELYKEFGYEHLSNFSAAFRIKFGINPNEVKNEPFK